MNTKSANQSRISHLARRLGSVVLALGPAAVIVVEVAGKFIP
jgi:hypothetical protein